MKPDIDDPIGIIDPHPNAILVAGDVEHRTAGLENARAANGSLHVRCRRPVSSSDLLFGVYDVGPIPWITVGTTNLGAWPRFTWPTHKTIYTDGSGVLSILIA